MSLALLAGATLDGVKIHGINAQGKSLAYGIIRRALIAIEFPTQSDFPQSGNDSNAPSTSHRRLCHCLRGRHACECVRYYAGPAQVRGRSALFRTRARWG